MLSTSEIITLILLFILIWTYWFYPMFVGIISKFHHKPVRIRDDFEPEVTIIISLYNEENFVEDCIDSIFKSDYPASKIQVIAGSDGSTDKTLEKLNKLKEKYHNIRIFEFNRSGKSLVLNQLMTKAETDIVLFMDADTRLRHDSLRKLLENFADSDVGCCYAAINMVTAKKLTDSGAKGEVFYQDWESKLRIAESRISSTVNILGTLHGIRKELLRPIPNNLVCDDLFLLINGIEQGKRAIFVPSSVVDEVRGKSLSGEIKRRIRFVGGGLGTFIHFKKVILGKGWISFFIWNHKMLRYLTPFIMLWFIISLFFIPTKSYFWNTLFIIQGIIYLSAFVGFILERLKIKDPVFKLPLFFVSMNIGFLLGFVSFFRKSNIAVWERIDT